MKNPFKSTATNYIQALSAQLSAQAQSPLQNIQNQYAPGTPGSWIQTTGTSTPTVTSTLSTASDEMSPSEQCLIIMLVELFGPHKAQKLVDLISKNPMPHLDVKKAEKILEKLHKNEDDIEKVIEECAKEIKL